MLSYTLIIIHYSRSMNKTNSLRCLSIEFRFETMFPCSILFFTETSKSEILSRGIADTSILLSCPLVSFDSHFFFFSSFYRGRILLGTRRACAARAAEADLWLLPKDECVLRDRGYGKTRNTSEGNNSFLQLHGSEHGERVIPVSP